MANIFCSEYPLRYWYLNPDIDPKDPSVIYKYYRKQVEEGSKGFGEEREERERKQKRQQNEEIEFKPNQKDLKQIEKELQKAFDKINITIKI